MKVKDKNIDGVLVSAKSWGFFKLLDNKKRFLDIVGKSADQIIDFFNSVESTDGIDEMIGIVKSLVSSLSSEEIRWFATTILENVTVSGKAMNTEADIDEVLSGNSMLFYKIVMLVLEVNYGDFFEVIRAKLNLKAETSLES